MLYIALGYLLIVGGIAIQAYGYFFIGTGFIRFILISMAFFFAGSCLIAKGAK